MPIYSSIDLNDSEILALEKGPIAWAQARMGATMNIDGFVNAVSDQIRQLGFTVESKVFDTNVPGAYRFEFEINGRSAGSVFDPDRQVHEVVNNLLELPGQEKGFIKTKESAQRLLDRDVKPSKGKHKH